jgi:hypothetical protein
LELLKRAEDQGVKLRIMGAVAIRLHAKGMLEESDALRRRITDMDFVGYSKQTNKIEKLISDAGYDSVKAQVTPGLLLNRLIFVSKKEPGRHIDVFLDELRMSHTIDYRDQLDKDFPTVSLAHLLLQKMQIVRINEKDIKDTLALLLEHAIGQNDKEMVDDRLIARTLATDWGFYYTVTTNLGKARAFMETYQLSPEKKATIEKRIDQLVHAIESEPKTLRWKLRARVGTKQKWYEEVEEVERATHLTELGNP